MFCKISSIFSAYLASTSALGIRRRTAEGGADEEELLPTICRGTCTLRLNPVPGFSILFDSFLFLRERHGFLERQIFPGIHCLPSILFPTAFGGATSKWCEGINTRCWPGFLA